MMEHLLEKYLTAYNADDFSLTTALKPLKLNMEKGPWVAGGCLRRLVMNEPVSKGDIDVFFMNGTQLQLCMARLGRQNENLDKYRNNNAYFWTHNGVEYNLVFNLFYYRPDEVIKSFDFTICQFVTDGTTLLTMPDTLEHCKQRELHPYKFVKRTRLIKYLGLGFHPFNSPTLTAKTSVIFERIQKYTMAGYSDNEIKKLLRVDEKIIY